MSSAIADLLKSFQSLLAVSRQEDEKYLTAGLSRCCEIVHAIQKNDLDYDDGLKLLKSEFHSMLTPHAGLSELFVWNDDAKERARVNTEIGAHLDYLWRFLR